MSKIKQNNYVLFFYNNSKKWLTKILKNEQLHATYLLHKAGIQKIDILDEVSHKDLDESLDIDKLSKQQEPKESALDKNSTRLVLQAKDEKIDPVIAREDEINRITQILSRRKKNNPILVGESGVGKTAIAEALAIKIAKDEVPSILKNSKNINEISIVPQCRK